MDTYCNYRSNFSAVYRMLFDIGFPYFDRDEIYKALFTDARKTIFYRKRFSSIDNGHTSLLWQLFYHFNLITPKRVYRRREMMLVSEKAEIWAKCGDDLFYGLEGEKKDYELAVNFYERAMKKKHPHATFMLAICNELGRGVTQDKEYAELLYEMAAEYGDKDAQKRLKTKKTIVPTPPIRDFEHSLESETKTETKLLSWMLI